MAAARFGAKFKPISPHQRYHVCISYHETAQRTVEDIEKKLTKLNFKITKVCCKNRTSFSKSLKSSDGWVEVVTKEYENCEHCESCYNTFTEVRKETKTKLLQKWIQMPKEEVKWKTVLRVHSDYSADVDAFSGQEKEWFGDLQLAIVSRFHAFLSYHESDKAMAEKIMDWLKDKGYLFTHTRKFLSSTDTKAAVENKMSEKIIVLFSDLYMKNKGDLDALVLPVVRDRGPAAWIPVVLEFREEIFCFLEYFPRLYLTKDIDNQNETGTWKEVMDILQNAMDNEAGLPSDCGTPTRNGPPEKLPFKFINEVVDSVGKICIIKPKRKIYGTGFRVGKNNHEDHLYIFAAYHVFAEIIDDMVNLLVRQCGDDEEQQKSLLSMIYQKEVSVDDWKSYNFRQRKPGELKFRDFTEDRQRLEKLWNAEIEFLNQRTFYLEMDIPFMSQEHDVIILKMGQKGSTDSNVPNPLKLDRGIGKFWHLTGCCSRDQIKDVSIATWCPVFEKCSFEHSEYWWSRIILDTKQQAKIHEEFNQLNRLVPFKCAEGFDEGCSGSPCWVVDQSSGQVYVQGLYLGCLPDVYFTNTKEKPEDLAFRHRPETALCMNKIYDLLSSSEMHALISNLGFSVRK